MGGENLSPIDIGTCMYNVTQQNVKTKKLKALKTLKTNEFKTVKPSTSHQAIYLRGEGDTLSREAVKL